MDKKNTNKDKKITGNLNNDRIIVQVYIPSNLMNKILVEECDKDKKQEKQIKHYYEKMINLSRAQVNEGICDCMQKIEDMQKEVKYRHLEISSNLDSIFNLVVIFGSLILLFSILIFIFLLLK